MEVWEKEENFSSSFCILREKLFLPKCIQGGFTTFFDEKLYLQTHLGSYFNIHAVIHELSHFIVHEYQYAFVNNWGLRNPNLCFSGISIDPITSNNNNPIIMETKVWAVQFLIECMCGFRKLSDPLPEHDEVVYVNVGKYLNRYDEIKDFTMDKIQSEVSRLMKTDYEKAFIEKITHFPEIIKNNSSQYIQKFQYTDIEKHTIKWSKDVNCDILLTVDNGWYSVMLNHVENEEIVITDEACITRDINKAKNIFKRCVKLNTF